MSDFGTTGFQVAPKAPTEDEMRSVQDILKRAVDTIVGMSQLQADVAKLTQSVNELQQSVDHYRNTVASQDETIVYLRGERDRALGEARSWQDRAISAERDRDTLKNAISSHAETIDRLKADLHQASTDRDNHALKAMDLEDQLKAAHDKIAAVKDGFETIFGKLNPPEAVQASPVVVPIAEQAPQAEPHKDVAWWEKPAVTG